MDTSSSLRIKAILREYFPDFSPDLVEDISKVAELKHISNDEIMIDVGNYIKSVPLLYNGMVKIFREDHDGNELFLYYLYPGEACAISFVCSVKESKSTVRAQTVRDSDFVIFPIKHMDEWMLKHKTWYQYVLQAFNHRFEDVLKTIDEVAFQRMDERLANYLQKNVEAYGSNVIATSHQDIAYELNSSREVISRLLKKMEKDGMVNIKRGKIEILKLA